MTHASQNSHRENQKGRRIAFRDALATEACPGRKRRSRSRKYSVAEAHQPLKLGGYEKSRLALHRAAGRDPVLERTQIEHLGVAQLLQRLAGERRASARGAVEDDGLGLREG